MLTHPQVPGQCTRFLRSELRARAGAAGELDGGGGADGGRRARAAGRRRSARVLAAQIYGGTVIREGVQDRDDNETRFVWLARRAASAARAAAAACEPARAARGRPRSCSGARAPSTPGWLVRCLDEFARREINLTKIESRPRRERLGSYMFFVDLAGARRGAAGRARRSPACGRCARRCACSAPTGRRRAARRRSAAPTRVRPAAPRERDAPARLPPLKMESTVPPEPVGSVSPSEHQRHGPEHIARHGDGRSGARPERDVRADQRVHGAPRGGAAAEGEGGAARARPLGAALGELDARAPGGDPPGQLRAAFRATPTGARSPAARCSRATAGPASTAARART